MTPVRLPFYQGTDAWLAARRSFITSTDIGVLLGLNPWKCEADLADEKLDGITSEPNLRMRVGLAVQALIGDEYERQTGRHVRPVRRLWQHPDIEWAGASPDFTAKGRRIVEAKRSTSRNRWADGVPDDVLAQVQWTLGVSGYPVADVAVLLGDDELVVVEQEFDAGLFDDLVVVAEDFRRRLVEGGPFARDAARIRRDHPSDDGTEMVADVPLAEAVLELMRLRANKADVEKAEDSIKAAVQARMGDHMRLIGDGWVVTWKQSKDIEQTDWRSLADGLLRQMPAHERDALVGTYTATRAGVRPFRVVVERE